jgi:hypothetical protein
VPIIAFADVNEETGQATANEIRKLGRRVFFSPTDVSRPQSTGQSSRKAGSGRSCEANFSIDASCHGASRISKRASASRLACWNAPSRSVFVEQFWAWVSGTIWTSSAFLVFLATSVWRVQMAYWSATKSSVSSNPTRSASESSGFRRNSTIIFPIPIDLFEPFLNLRRAAPPDGGTKP